MNCSRNKDKFDKNDLSCWVLSDSDVYIIYHMNGCGPCKKLFNDINVPKSDKLTIIKDNIFELSVICVCSNRLNKNDEHFKNIRRYPTIHHYKNGVLQKQKNQFNDIKDFEVDRYELVNILNDTQNHDYRIIN